MQIKPLEWTPGKNFTSAQSPSTQSRSLEIHFEEGRYWGVWALAHIPGHATLEAAKAEAQAYHDEYMMRWLNEEPSGPQKVAIPRHMDNEESQLYATIVVSEREIALASAMRRAAIERLIKKGEQRSPSLKPV